MSGDLDKAADAIEAWLEQPEVKWVLVVSTDMNGQYRRIDVPVRVLDGGWTTLDEAMTWAVEHPDEVFLGGKGALAPVPVTVVEGK